MRYVCPESIFISLSQRNGNHRSLCTHPMAMFAIFQSSYYTFNVKAESRLSKFRFRDYFLC